MVDKENKMRVQREKGMMLLVLVYRMKVERMQEKEKKSAERTQVDQVEILKLQNHPLFPHVFLRPK